MKRGLRFFPFILILLVLSCQPFPGDAETRDWVAVLGQKHAMMISGEERVVEARQLYVDALSSFLERYPRHVRARKAYDEVELDFARSLADRGLYIESARHYESYLSRNQADTNARAELSFVLDRSSVTPEEFARLARGMTAAQVRALLGEPPPGWKEKRRRGRQTTEAWFYRRQDGKVAGVFFSDGKLFDLTYASELPGSTR